MALQRRNESEGKGRRASGHHSEFSGRWPLPISEALRLIHEISQRNGERGKDGFCLFLPEQSGACK